MYVCSKSAERSSVGNACGERRRVRRSEGSEGSEGQKRVWGKRGGRKIRRIGRSDGVVGKMEARAGQKIGKTRRSEGGVGRGGGVHQKIRKPRSEGQMGVWGTRAGQKISKNRRRIGRSVLERDRTAGWKLRRELHNPDRKVGTSDLLLGYCGPACV